MTSGIKTECLINGLEYNCRTCFDPGRTIYPLTDKACNMKTWRDVLKDIAQLETKDDELLPKTLCCKCLEKLKKSYDFVLQIHSANDKYSQLLTKNANAVLNEADNFTDCLAESAIALPLEQCIPEIKMEEEFIDSYDNLSKNKLQKENEATFENEDIDDPFTETFDDDLKSTLDQMEENESATKAITGKSTTKRNRGKKIKHLDEIDKLFRKPVRRPKKVKQPKKTVTPTQTDGKDDIIKTEDDDGKETILCDKCSQTFPTIHTYQRHQQAEHSAESNEEKNKCPICSKKFRNSWYVVDHIKVVHDKLKPFKCSHCPKSFASAHSKRIHELTHTDNFPYACEYCERRFRLSSKLKIHSEIHTTKPELLCPICKRSQKSQEELEVHVKNHDDNRLQCPSCGNMFRRNAQLKDHYNAVHLKLRPYKCEFCELGFGDRKTRRVHQRTHHKQELSKTKSTLTESDDDVDDDDIDDDYNDDDYDPSRSLTASEEDDDSNDDDDSGPTSATLSSESEGENHDVYRKRLRRKRTPAATGTSRANFQYESNLVQQNKISDDTDLINKSAQSLLLGYRLYSKPTAWRLVQCKLCCTNFKTSKELRQHLKDHSDIDSLHSLDLNDNIVQYLFPNIINLDLIKETICRDIKRKQWFKYYAVLNEFSYEMSISDTEVEELELEKEHEKSSRKRFRKYRCVLCAQVFSHKYQIFPHFKQDHSKEKAPFKCDRCSLEFVSDKMYKQHLQTHCRNKDKALLCEFCCGKFVWPENVKNHKCATKLLENSPAAVPEHQEPLREQLLKSILRCCLCEFSFQRLSHLREHMSLHADGNTGIDFKNCTYIKQFESSKPIDYEMLKQQIQNDYNKCQISRFYQAMDKYGNEMDISDSESESDSETGTGEMEVKNVKDAAYKCKVCKESFQKRKHVMMHQEEWHTDMEMIVNCEVCNRKYVSVDLLLQHLKRECRNEYRQLGQQCEFCNVRFIWPNHLLKHKEIQHHLKKEPVNSSITSCGSATLSETVTEAQPVCDISSCESLTLSETDSSATDEESDNHSVIEQQAATVMFKETKDKDTTTAISNDSISNHKQIAKLPISELESPNFLCSFCGEFFSTNSILTAHIKIAHNSKKSMKCGHCQMTFTDVSDLQSHTCLTHAAKRSFKCSFCQKTFDHKGVLLAHKRIHRGETKIQCSICDKSFSTSVNLGQHMLSHKSEKPYECDVCGKKFLCNPNLKRHRRMTRHGEGVMVKKSNKKAKKEKPCSVCGIYLSKNTNLARHMRTHTGEKPYKCEFCERAFAHRPELLTHHRTHGERPYQCTVCKKSFNTTAYLKKHMSFHTSEKSYQCRVCDKTFACAAYLNKHRNAQGH